MLKSIRSKLFSILAGAGFIALLVAALGYWGRTHVEEVLDEVTGNRLPSSIALGQLNLELINMRLWTRLAVVDLEAENPDAVHGDRRLRDAALVAAERARAVYEALPQDRAEVELWRDFGSRFSEFSASNTMLWSHLDAGALGQAQAMHAAHQQAAEAALAACAKVVQYQATTAVQLSKDADDAQALSNRVLVGVLLLALLLIGLAGGSIVSAISARTTMLKEAAENLARGDFDAQLGARGEDEFGPLHDAMRSVVESLRESARAAADIAKGELDVEVIPRGPRDQLAISFNRMVASLKDTAKQANLIALGDFGADFTPRNDKDLLGIALKTMTVNLRDAAAAAEAIASGDLAVGVTSHGPRDLLSGAINRMVGTLRDVSRQASAIGSGDYSAEVVPRSEKDELSLALRAMTLSLREATGAAEAVANGHLDIVVTSKGPRDAQAAALNRMIANLREAARQANVIATGDYAADVVPRSERDELGIALRKMTRSLRDSAREARDADWVKTGVAKVNALVLGQDNMQTLATSAVTALAEHLGAKVGAIYLMEHDQDGPLLQLLGSYAYTQRKNLSSRFRLGEGLVGQAALERKQIVLENAPEDYVRVTSGLGETLPRNICVAPVVYRGELRAVIELGTLTVLTAVHQQYIELVAAVIGAAFEIARNQEAIRTQQVELQANNEELKQQQRSLQAASNELKAQQVELEQSNEELEAQMQRTMESESRLKVQQRELEVTNQELGERNGKLEIQKREIERARSELAKQADDLAIASKYKSEFLANMSHELRTPLNSLLLLARSLRDNPEGNLNADQQESASVIFASGNDLLNLINEILDLAKIEAGRMELRLETVEVTEIAQTLVRQFGHMAKNQGLTLAVHVAPDAPTRLVTDPHRLGQVLKNLVGNALKFTDTGGVTLSFGLVAPGVDLSRSRLTPERAMAIRITDTGIGIPHDKQKIVFEAFQQADSGDKRRYGGTGLGLSISREIVALLGGEIHLESEPGVGSTFTLFIPFETRSTQSLPAPVLSSNAPSTAASAAAAASVATRAPAPAPVPAPGRGHAVASDPSASALVPSIPDDRDGLEEHDRTILIVEDDARFAGVLAKEVRTRGFKAIVALRGGEGLALAKTYRPCGVILDINLPDTNGWSVLTALKQDTTTRHIPVHIVSAEDATLEGLRIGAIGHAHKPLRSEDIDAILSTIESSSATAEKAVLVVEDDPIMRRETCRIIGNGNVHVTDVASGKEALAALKAKRFDLLVLELGLPDMQGLALLEAASANKAHMPPVIVYTVRELTSEEEVALRQYADSIIIKDVRSQERLIDEVALFLHRVVNDLPEEKKRTIRHLYESDEQLRGKKILIVEDDMRTMFAMAKLLASHGIAPLKAVDGQQALELMEAQPDIDLVLLDMMMPVMDGYETAQRIRAQARYLKLPIIALTAKAMKEDRQKCIDAGATDYLSKPVDQDRLISLLRVWLCR